MQLENVTLETICSGAAQEKFGYELEAVLKNIRDPNTEWKKPRRITITIDLLPTEGRAEAKLVTNVRSTIAPPKPAVSTLYFGLKDGQIQAGEITNMFPKPSDGKKVYTINKEE